MKVRLFQDPKEKKRRGPRSCPWSVEWRENGRRRSKAVGTKADAEDFAAVKRAELLDGVKGINTRKKWADFVEEYTRDEAEASGKRPKTIKEIRAALNLFTKLCKPEWVYLVDARTLDTFRRKRLQMIGVHKQKVSGETVKKELRHVRAALNIAKRWKYIADVPSMPVVRCDKREKAHVTEEHFIALMKAADVATMPAAKMHQGLPDGSTAGDWWRAMFTTCWVTGARIDAILRLRWEDMDWKAGRVLSRAQSTKQRTDTRPDIRAALPYLEKIQGSDPRLLPWNHAERTLYREFARIQEAAGIELPCRDADTEGHACNAWCHVYGFHAFRYAHARFNYESPQLQNQMGHACRATTDRYREWAGRQLAEYDPYVPSGLEDGNADQKQRENGGKDSGKPLLRVVSA